MHELILKFIWKGKGAKIDKTIFLMCSYSQDSSTGFQCFRIYYKTTSIKTAKG